MGDAHGIDCDPGYDNSGLRAQKQWRSEEACKCLRAECKPVIAECGC